MIHPEVPIARFRTQSLTAGLTLVEVMMSILLIALGLGSIFAVNSQSAHTMRMARQAAVASLILQQRIEEMRNRSWAEISSSTALAVLLQEPTESEQELPGIFSEVLTVSPMEALESGPKGGPKGGSQSFRVRRENGSVVIDAGADLSKCPTLLVQSSVKWKDRGRAVERTQRSIICRAGLTRNGIFGSGLGRVRNTAVASTP